VKFKASKVRASKGNNMNVDNMLNRRSFMRGSAAAGGLAAAGGMPGAATAFGAQEDDALDVYQLGPRIWIRKGKNVITCYRAHESQKYPYFYPLIGPASGLPLTVETSLPYPHHRSLWFACDRVNGGNYWQEGYDRGQIFSAGPKVAEATAEKVTITDACLWKRPGAEAPCRDDRSFTFGKCAVGYTLDVEIRWIALTDMTIPRTNHSLFSMRSATDLAVTGGGNLVSAAGNAGEKATFGKPANWMAFHGKRGGDGPAEGIAVLDHPKNMGGATPWFTRNYGFASPTPMYFGKESFTLPKDESVTLRYRVVLFAGSPASANLNSSWDDWANDT
jgi:hypothetical protein